MKVSRGKQRLSDLEIRFGFSNFRENYQVLYEYLQEKNEKLTKLKEKFGVLNELNEEELYYVKQALILFEKKDENKENPNLLGSNESSKK